MDSSLLSLVPQLSIGAICVCALVYICKMYADNMQKRDTQYSEEFSKRDVSFRAELRERENAFRELEKEMRTVMSVQISKNTTIMERIINHLDTPHRKNQL